MTYMTQTFNKVVDAATKVSLPIPQPTKEETFYQLMLSPEEVVALRIVASKIGGSPRETLRGQIDSIARKLPSFSSPSDDDDYDAHGKYTDDTALYFDTGSLGDAFDKAVAELR